MARVLMVVLSVALLYGCGQASSPVEKQEKQAGVEEATPQPVTSPTPGQEETTTEVAGNIPISGAIGESVETPSFDYRVLDLFTTDHYYYLESPQIQSAEDAFSQAGKFVVITYAVTNTSPQTVTANLGAMLHARAGSKIEVYDESDQALHPYSSATIGGMELAPREVRLGQYIFDVPTDVEPELLAVLYEDELEEPRGEAGAIDLTEEDPQGPQPQEILALQYEYGNMKEWQKSYELFAQESKEQVSLEQYRAYFEQGPPFATTDYAFPSVKIEGDRATIERIFTQQTPRDEYQDKATQEAVLEDAGWRIVMRDDQVKAFTS